ncbi:MAG: magnesium transporter [Gaiellales bacterium]|jgi:magnesium transporter|nr:magnesium transporter [Gaiellales bacterium]
MAEMPSDAVVWIDLVDPDRDAIELALGRTLHARALEQLLSPHRHRDDPRPTLEGHDDYVFGVFLVPELLDDATVLYREVDVVAARDIVMTVRKTANAHGPFDCAAALQLHREGRVQSPGMVVYHLVDDVAEGYLDLTDRLNERIDALEDHVDDWEGARVRDELSALRHDILHVRRTLSPTRDAVRRVFDDRVDARVGNLELFDHSTELHFADAYEKLMRASEALDLSRDLVAGVRDYYQAKIANDQNEVMKRLTIVASLLLPASLIVGFYGMNVHGVPEYHWSFGYEYVLALIGVLTAAQLVWFRRKRWI